MRTCHTAIGRNRSVQDLDRFLRLALFSQKPAQGHPCLGVSWLDLSGLAIRILGTVQVAKSCLGLAERHPRVRAAGGECCEFDCHAKGCFGLAQGDCQGGTAGEYLRISRPLLVGTFYLCQRLIWLADKGVEVCQGNGVIQRTGRHGQSTLIRVLRLIDVTLSGLNGGQCLV